ncbi:hypothetical protein LTR33_014678, partial [Friedmanniomyces endolithicus]
ASTPPNRLGDPNSQAHISGTLRDSIPITPVRPAHLAPSRSHDIFGTHPDPLASSPILGRAPPPVFPSAEALRATHRRRRHRPAAIVSASPSPMVLADAAWDEEDPFRDARVAAARAAAKGEEGGRQGGLPSRWIQKESQRGKYWPVIVCPHSPAGGTDSAFEYLLQRRTTTSDELMAKAMYPKQPNQKHMVLMRLCEPRKGAYRLAIEHVLGSLLEGEGDAGAEIGEDRSIVTFDALLLW